MKSHHLRFALTLVLLLAVVTLARPAHTDELGVDTIVVGYTPDGPEELTYRKWLQDLAADGTHVEATEMGELPAAMGKVLEALR